MTGAPTRPGGRHNDLLCVFLKADILASSGNRLVMDSTKSIDDLAQRLVAAEERAAKAEAALLESEERFKVLFSTSPAPLLVVRSDAPRFTIAEVNDAYLAATMRRRDQLIGRGMFEAFPDNPGDPVATGVKNLRASFERTLVSLQSDAMAIQKYDIASPDGHFVERWWSPINSPVLNQVGEVEAIIHHVNDVTQEHHAAATLRESGERQTYLLELSDILQRLSNPNEIKAAAMHVLGTHLSVSRAQYHEVDETGEYYSADGIGFANGLPLLDLKYAISQFGSFVTQDFEAGRPFRSNDLQEDPRPTAQEREAYGAYQIRAGAGIPLIRGGKLVAILAVHDRHPHPWTDLEMELIRETAERVWVSVEKVRTDAVLRESEEKYRTLFEEMDEGFVLCELVRDAAGRAVDFRYVDLNPAVMRHTGMAPEALRGRRGREAFPDRDPWYVKTYAAVVDSGHSVLEEHYFEHVDRWLRMNVFPRGGDRFAVLYSDITDRKRVETVLRDSERRQAFLLRFTDAIRSEPNEQALIERAVLMLAEELAVDRAYATRHYPAENLTKVVHEVHAPGLVPLPATLRFSDFPEAGRQTFERTLVFADTANDQSLTEEDRSSLAAMGVGAFLSRPLRREGSPIFALGVVSTLPRRWTPAEAALIEEATERAWEAAERVRGEAARQQSEQRFRQFANAASVGLWMRDVATLDMEYVSPAISAIYGVAADQVMGGVRRWAVLVVPDDRATALENIEKARLGTPAIHEFRIRRPDGSFRWIRNTDFPLFNAEGKIERIGGIAEDVTETRQAVEHQGVLLHELQHRVRNIMAMLRSIATRSATGPESVEEYRTILEGRLLAIARVQALLTREANTGGSLRDVLQTEIGAMAQGSNKVMLTGPEVMLSPKAVEVLSLAFHELATNALKYGALSTPARTLSVTWQRFEKGGSDWLAVDWTEKGSPSRQPSTRRGFGSELIEGRIPYELGGTGVVSIGPGGAACHIEFPLSYAESILETDAPSSATVFGGTLDMTGAPDLSSQNILVVEDDFYAASDTAAALHGAGARVLGPCPSEDATLKLLETEQPTAAVVDLNLGGGGPRFNVALALKKRGIPFVFLTGYDPEVIPPEMADVPRLQKPLPLRDVIEAISQLR